MLCFRDAMLHITAIYFYMCVLILLYMCPHTTIYMCVQGTWAHLLSFEGDIHIIAITSMCVSAYSICVLILLYICVYRARAVVRGWHAPRRRSDQVRLYMCPHTTALLLLYYCFITVLLIIYRACYREPTCYRCPHTTICVSSYYYICALILLYMCPHTTIYVPSYYYICVLVLLYMCPRTTTYVSSYYHVSSYYVSSYHYICVLVLLCVLIPLDMWPHTTINGPHTAIYVSSYYCIYVLIVLFNCDILDAGKTQLVGPPPTSPWLLRCGAPRRCRTALYVFSSYYISVSWGTRYIAVAFTYVEPQGGVDLEAFVKRILLHESDERMRPQQHRSPICMYIYIHTYI